MRKSDKVLKGNDNQDDKQAAESSSDSNSENKKIRCLNPLCDKFVPYLKSTSVNQLYCTVPCYHFFSPKKIEVLGRWFPNTPRDEVYIKFGSIIYYINSQFFLLRQRAESLNVSKSAYQAWDDTLAKDIKTGLLDSLCGKSFYDYAPYVIGGLSLCARK